MRAGAPVAPVIFGIVARGDSLSEETEGFIVFLEIDENINLDERDVGMVDLVRDTYLVRIADGAIPQPLGMYSAENWEIMFPQFRGSSIMKGVPLPI